MGDGLKIKNGKIKTIRLIKNTITIQKCMDAITKIKSLLHVEDVKFFINDLKTTTVSILESVITSFEQFSISKRAHSDLIEIFSCVSTLLYITNVLDSYLGGINELSYEGECNKSNEGNDLNYGHQLQLVSAHIFKAFLNGKDRSCCSQFTSQAMFGIEPKLLLQSLDSIFEILQDLSVPKSLRYRSSQLEVHFRDLENSLASPNTNISQQHEQAGKNKKLLWYYEKIDAFHGKNSNSSQDTCCDESKIKFTENYLALLLKLEQLLIDIGMKPTASKITVDSSLKSNPYFDEHKFVMKNFKDQTQYMIESIRSPYLLIHY